MLTLTPDQHRKLVDLLLKCRCTRSASARQSLLEALPDNIQTSVTFGAKDSARTQVTTILRTCLDFPQGAGFSPVSRARC